MAELRQVIASYERMTNGEITRKMRRRLANAGSPLVPRVRAAILNIPSKGTVPYKGMPGLRVEIAACVESWVFIHGPQVQVGVAVNAAKMPDGKKALPLYMEGAKAPWRHPLFGDYGHWVVQSPHPYFYGAVAFYGPASRNALERAADDIARALG